MNIFVQCTKLRHQSGDLQVELRPSEAFLALRPEGSQHLGYEFELNRLVVLDLRFANLLHELLDECKLVLDFVNALAYPDAGFQAVPSLERNNSLPNLTNLKDVTIDGDPICGDIVTY